MEEIKSSISLNLSNQANCFNSKESSSTQFNFFIILGLGCLSMPEAGESYEPIYINVNKTGEILITGLDGEIVNDQNLHIYSDKKVTTSDE